MDDKKFAALGNTKELLPLKSLGFNIFGCKDFKEASEWIEKLNSEKYDLVIVSENVLEGKQADFLDIIRDFPLAILVLPQYEIRRNIAKELVKRIIKEAVGF